MWGLSKHPCVTKYPPFCRHPVRENPLKQLFLAQSGGKKRGYPYTRIACRKGVFSLDRWHQRVQPITHKCFTFAAQQMVDAWLQNTRATGGAQKRTHHRLCAERCEQPHNRGSARNVKERNCCATGRDAGQNAAGKPRRQQTIRSPPRWSAP